jgi:hypothetical protein
MQNARSLMTVGPRRRITVAERLGIDQDDGHTRVFLG